MCRHIHVYEDASRDSKVKGGLCEWCSTVLLTGGERRNVKVEGRKSEGWSRYEDIFPCADVNLKQKLEIDINFSPGMDRTNNSGDIFTSYLKTIYWRDGGRTRPGTAAVVGATADRED